MELVNAMSCPEFTRAFADALEICPLAASTVWAMRPFRDVGHLEEAFATFLHSLSPTVQDGLLRCHPDLAFEEAAGASLSGPSAGEQAAAGALLKPRDPDTRARMARACRLYSERFGFPLIMVARRLLPGRGDAGQRGEQEEREDADLEAASRELCARMERRLGAPSVSEERRAALGAVRHICALRLADTVASLGSHGAL